MEASPTLANRQEPQLLTHSRLACYRACPRKHYIRFELGLVPEVEGLPLRVGRAFHLACELDERGVEPATALEAALTDPYDLALVAAMYGAHHAHYEGRELETVATELPFDLPLTNPETGRPTPLFRIAGKIDRIVRLSFGRMAILERKTTSRDFAPGSDYWLRLRMDPQPSIYVIAARAMGYPIDTILYDVTRRPALRPLQATPPEARKYTKDKATGETRLYANQREADETPDAFCRRVVCAMMDDPERHFARVEIARLDSDLAECAAELWQQQLSIRTAQRMGYWYRNPGSCVHDGTTCDYLPVCLNNDLETNTPAGFRRGEIHPELSGDATSGG